MTASGVVLVEEASIRIVLDHLCSSLGITDIQVLEHNGKADLAASISKKINGWRSPKPPRFVISRDADGADRQALVANLMERVPPHAADRVKFRIVIPELEAWYFGDISAVVKAGIITDNAAAKISRSARLRNLCALVNAKQEFKKAVGQIGQMHAAHEIGHHLDPHNNRSPNFIAFMNALRWATEDR